MIGEILLGLNKYGFHVFQYKGARNYQPNYSTQTLSSNSSDVAEISGQVMKHITNWKMVPKWSR